ncbi:MAG: LAGLIDADG family homing endonuclease, partial [Rudaea sp.]|nr:LAGLIDADG family homing endonuclease [Rudaea sp.]
MDKILDPVDFLTQIARTNFAAFVSAVHRPRFKHSAFSANVCRAVDQFVDDVLAGKRPVLMLTAPPQHGKEIESSVSVLTANRGWITHGELCAGDVVYRPDGTTTRVIAIASSMPSDMRVTLSDGAQIGTHSQHEWLLHPTWINGRAARIFETCEVAARGTWCGTPGMRGARANFQLPAVRPLENASKTLPLAPYTLGMWLGDGTRTEARITVSGEDTAIFAGIEADGYAETRRWRCNEKDFHASFAGIRQPLRDLHLLNEGYRSEGGRKPKFIPGAYFSASFAQRMELLAGLIDSDGYVYPKNGRVTFSNTEPELVKSVERLVATFGWRVTTTWFEPRLSTSSIQGRERVAQVCFQPDVVIPCRVLRYREAFKPKAMKRRRSVVRVETGDFGWGNCIQVEHPDGMYLVGDTLVPTHNSSLIARCLPPYLFGRLTGELPA